jgi:hypothetical protein
MLHDSGVFGLLRDDWKRNGQQPERQKERTLEHAGTQNQIPTNANEKCGQPAGVSLKR